MPELPEVETVVNTLRETILGQKITALQVLPEGIKLLGDISPSKLSQMLVGDQIVQVSRQGKFILIRLATGRFLIVHLRMTGKFMYRPNNGTVIVAPEKLVNGNDGELERYRRIHLQLDRGELSFLDKRRFATFHFVEDIKGYPGLKRLGPDALSVEFSPEYLANRLAKSQRKVYTLLLDQSVVAGIGNIYACEVLALTGIHPLSLGSAITPEKLALLHKQIKSTLTAAIAAKGTTFSDYTNAYGEKGDYQNELLVYGKSELTISNCNYIVQKIKIGGRTVHFAEGWQTLFIGKTS